MSAGKGAWCIHALHCAGPIAKLIVRTPITWSMLSCSTGYLLQARVCCGPGCNAPPTRAGDEHARGAAVQVPTGSMQASGQCPTSMCGAQLAAWWTHHTLRKLVANPNAPVVATRRRKCAKLAHIGLLTQGHGRGDMLRTISRPELKTLLVNIVRKRTEAR